MEPYRIKVVEPIPKISKRLRANVLHSAGYNMFQVPARYVMIDLISDSGTGAMTAQQWASMLNAREDFAGQQSSERFILATQKVTGLEYIQPVHQGRTAEDILFGLLLRKGDVVLANTHFETTRANIESLGCRAIDLPSNELPYLGNIDVERMKQQFRRHKRVRMVILTITSNINGGQPVSIANIALARRLTREYHALLVLDACRFADNAYLIKEYGRLRSNVKSIGKRIFGYCDMAYMSNKKDGLANIGGFIGVRSKQLHERVRDEVIRQEAYPSSGGLAARDVAAMTEGLFDATNEEFLRSHISNIRYLAHTLKDNGVPVFEPVGGHAVVILPKKQKYYSYALAAEVYVHTGIRGGVFGNSYRLALPRRVYTREHLQYVGEAIGKVYASDVPKLRVVNRPGEFFNFFAQFRIG
jgi:tryptophanase